MSYKNFYELLDLKRNCTQEDIKKSFIKLSKEFHPDKNKSKDAHEKFVKINEAYTTLSNPAKRTLYDNALSSRTNYEFNTTRTQESSYYYRNYNYTGGKSTQNSHQKSGLLFRLVILPKVVIVTALVLVTFFSSGLEMYFLKRGFESRRRRVEDQNISASLMLARAQHKAKLYGREEQLRRLKEGKLGSFDEDDELVEAYIRAKESRRFRSK